jgi:hypothetical protein
MTDANDRGDVEAARIHLVRAREIVERARLVGVNGIVVCELAVNAVARGELDEGRELFREGVALQRQDGDRWNLIGSLAHAAWAELAAGALDDATRLLLEAIAISLAIEDTFQRNEAMLVFALVRMAAGDGRGARVIMAATGWDLELPVHIDTHGYSLVALSIAALEPVCVPEYDEAAREGRAIGSIAMATSLVAARSTR